MHWILNRTKFDLPHGLNTLSSIMVSWRCPSFTHIVCLTLDCFSHGLLTVLQMNSNRDEKSLGYANKALREFSFDSLDPVRTIFCCSPFKKFIKWASADDSVGKVFALPCVVPWVQTPAPQGDSMNNAKETPWWIIWWKNSQNEIRSQLFSNGKFVSLCSVFFYKYLTFQSWSFSFCLHLLINFNDPSLWVEQYAWKPVVKKSYKMMHSLGIVKS